jgi:PadR family transcriptional regulator AphA
MSLRFAILGFLSSTPGTGYEIGREFAQGAGAYWSALPSQIYPELRELEKLGLIRGRIAKGDRLRRRVFHLTPQGEVALEAWVRSDTEYPPERDPERIKLIFLDKAPTQLIRRHLEQHIAHFTAKLEEWRLTRDAVARGTHRQLSARLAQRPEQDHALIACLKALALDGNIRRAENEIAWAREAIAAIETLTVAEPSLMPRA